MPDVVPLEPARRQLGLTYYALWQAYFELGGVGRPTDIERHLGGGLQLSDLEHDMLVHSLNEMFADRDMNHPLGYSRP